MFGVAYAQDRGQPWPRHVIDNSSQGADGVRLADSNRDGRMDIVTGWEEGGRIRVYCNPGSGLSKELWPSVTVGEVGSPEDAVFADIDGDGRLDVVSCCEGKVKTVWVHWRSAQPVSWLEPEAWSTEAIPTTQGAQMWMFSIPMQVDGKNGIDLIAGSKGGNAEIGWLQAPSDPHDLNAWAWHTIYKAGWIMSIFTMDMDSDGDLDVLASDRRGPKRGCLWLENPGEGDALCFPWNEHRIGGADDEVMFMISNDLDGDRLLDIVAATKGENQEILFIRRTSLEPDSWETHRIAMPPNTGSGKGVYIADIDLDGKKDIAFTCEHSRGKSGVIWLSYRESPMERDWDAHEISGPVGTKFDRIEMLDLDADGDLDLITCEESENLGVIWYENPSK